MNILRWIKHKKFFNKEEFELEHSVCPGIDYPFAKEFYPSTDRRYHLVKVFETLIKKYKGIEIYNCKFGIPTASPHIFNIYIYLSDRSKILGKDYNPFLNENLDFLELFKKALEVVSLEDSKDKRIQVFIEDFSVCSKSYSANQAMKKIEDKIIREFPRFSQINRWDTCLYIFFACAEDVDNLIKTGEINRLKHICYDIVKEFDDDNVWDYDGFRIRVDNQIHYDQYGGQHYFNSDAMSENILV